MADPWDSDPVVGAAQQAATIPWDNDPIAPPVSIGAGSTAGAVAGAPTLTVHPKDYGQLDALVGGLGAGLPFVDRAAAGVRTGAGMIGLGNTFGDKGSYAANLAQIQDEQANRSETHPVDYYGGSIASGVTMPLPGAGAALSGTTLSGKILGSAALGAGTGALYGASASQDLTNPTQTAASTGAGALGGAVLGGTVGPAVGGLTSAAARALLGESVPAVDGVTSPAARDLLIKYRTADDPTIVGRKLADIGPNAVLADAGPSLQGLAAGVLKPGQESDRIVTDALQQRDAGTNARLQAAADALLVPSQSPTQAAKQILASGSPYAADQQAALRAAPTIDISDIHQRIADAIPDTAPQSPERKALNNAYEMLGGADGPTNNPKQVYSARTAMDDLIKYGSPTEGQSTALKSQQGAYGTIRRDLSNALKQQVPGYEEPTDALRVLNQRADAIGEGADTHAMHPDDFAALVQKHYAQGTQDEFAAGHRSLLDKAFGTRDNDLTALKMFTQGENGYNLQNVATLYGQDTADALKAAADREVAMRGTATETIGKSNTRRLTAAAQALQDEQGDPLQLRGDLRNSNLTGLGLEGGRKALNAILRSIQPQVDNTLRDAQLARSLTASGDARDRLLTQLSAAQGALEAKARYAAQGGQVGRVIGVGLPQSVLAAALLANARR